MKFTLNIHNSYCQITGPIPQMATNVVTQVLTYQNDIEAEKGQIFYLMRTNKWKQGKCSDPEEHLVLQKKRAALVQRLRILEENEFVCWYRDQSFPTGLLHIVVDTLNSIQSQFEMVDHRVKPTRDFNMRWYNDPHEPRYYQKDMIDLGLLHGRGVFESAVGTGKSLVLTYLIKELSVNSLIVVPSRGLLQQLYIDLELHFGKNYVQMIDTPTVRKGSKLKPIRICTVHTLAALQKTNDLNHLVCDINAIHVDEIHHAGAASYTNLLPDIDHIYYRFGYTGTFLRNDSKVLDMWGFLSTKLYSYPAYKAIEEGYLTPVQVQLYELDGKKKAKYQTEYKANYCGNPVLLDQIANIINDARYHKPDSQILILVNRKDQSGKIIHEYLNCLGIQNAYISGDDDKEVIYNTISDFNEKKIGVLTGSSVIGEGIDVRSTDHLVMGQGGKSEIAIVQAVGRCVRLYPGKKIATVHDFNFKGTKFMERHLVTRAGIYDNNFDLRVSDVV